jgi:hypothetical protein
VAASDPGSDPLGRLAATLRRPRESLTAFKGLTPAQLTLLADAAEESIARRTADLDAQFERILGAAAAPWAAGAMRGRLVPELRRAFRGRER